MTTSLISTVATALDLADDLTVEARAVVHAALAGREALEAFLSSDMDVADDLQAVKADPSESTAESALIYLNHISAMSFRGIGGRVDVPLTPTPGLVLITGRNGSGKSSLAEACELALSKAIVRAGKSSTQSEGLTNLHKSVSAEVGVGLRIDGVGDVSIDCTLDKDDVSSAIHRVRAGADRYDLDKHGWSDAIGRYRPILTYGELAAIASAKPSDLFDPINNIIGLDALTTADQLLLKSGAEHSKPLKTAESIHKSLLAELQTIDDPRAKDLLVVLSGKQPDVVAARAVLAGTSGASVEVRQRLDAWALMTGPSSVSAIQAAEALAEARDHADAVAAGVAGRVGRLAELLDLAIAHREHDDEMCPICGQGRLDETWLSSARQRAREAREAASDVTTASLTLDRAREAARKLITASPPVLNTAPVLDVDPGPAARAWAALESIFDADLDEAARDRVIIAALPGAVDRVTEEVNRLQVAASAALASQNTIWEPIAERAAETLTALDAAGAAKRRVAAINSARSWLRELTNSLRRERMSQFETAATTIWNGLRQESNVSLDGVSLTGSNTRRQVQLDLSIDGTPGPQAVLSQGELAALGLALFLPRSTAAESPFRFIIIDDPVQSMDPSKVDGLARVLYQISTDRQVIVFTHDDRLLQAMRNLALPVTAFEVVRGDKSAVQVQLVADPVEQYLRDARALVKNSELPLDLVTVAVTGYCRDAIDEAALDLARRRLLQGDAAAGDVEIKLAAARTTWNRLALALLGNQNHTGARVNTALDELDPDIRGTISICVEGVHEPDFSLIKSLPDRVGQLVDLLRAV